MGTKSAMKARFSNGQGVRLVPVPANMRPTAESIEKMGREISTHIKSNDAMRNRSFNNAAQRSVH